MLLSAHEYKWVWHIYIYKCLELDKKDCLDKRDFFFASFSCRALFCFFFWFSFSYCFRRLLFISRHCRFMWFLFFLAIVRCFILFLVRYVSCPLSSSSSSHENSHRSIDNTRRRLRYWQRPDYALRSSKRIGGQVRERGGWTLADSPVARPCQQSSFETDKWARQTSALCISYRPVFPAAVLCAAVQHQQRWPYKEAE